MIEKIRKTNAVVYLEEPMPISVLHEKTVKAAHGAAVFPPGFDMPEFKEALVEALSSFDAAPYPQIWVPSVTGTFFRALKSCFPDKIFKTVSVVKSGACDYTAPEKYHQPARTPPPYPACPYTDSKVWQFAEKHAAPGALVWNVAG